MGAVGAVALFRTAKPEAFADLAGTHLCPEYSQQTDRDLGTHGRATGRGQVRLQHQPRVPYNEVRPLEPGEMFAIRAGRAMKVRVLELPSSPAEPAPERGRLPRAGVAGPSSPAPPAHPLDQLVGSRGQLHVLRVVLPLGEPAAELGAQPESQGARIIKDNHPCPRPSARRLRSREKEERAMRKASVAFIAALIVVLALVVATPAAAIVHPVTPICDGVAASDDAGGAAAGLVVSGDPPSPGPPFPAEGAANSPHCDPPDGTLH